jgi:hypothetical protein
MATASCSEDRGGDGLTKHKTSDLRCPRCKRAKGARLRATGVLSCLPERAQGRHWRVRSAACTATGRRRATRGRNLLTTRGRRSRAPTATSWVHKAHLGLAGEDVEARKHVEREDVAGEERGRGGAPRRGQPGHLLTGCCGQKRNKAGVKITHASALSTASNNGDEFFSPAWQQRTFMAAAAETQGEGEEGWLGFIARAH